MAMHALSATKTSSSIWSRSTAKRCSDLTARVAKPLNTGRPSSIQYSNAIFPQLDTEALSDFKVLVAGATGGVGRRIVEVLVEQGVPVRALVRDARKAREILPGISSGLVEVVEGDVFQYASLPKALGDANAVICATGASGLADPFGPFNVDYAGTANLVALSKLKKLNKFVLISSIGADDILNPLNLFWGILFWKKRAEEELQRSGLDYTIIRPGGLKDTLKSGELPGGIVMKPAGYYGLKNSPGNPGSILRRQVAETAVAALYQPNAANQVVEIVASKDAPRLAYDTLFTNVW
eukprot:CAMPEP_0119102932 /NCGR_PEP_ID=MMETSP1180-20130426/1516_1 /TAXON_ID=3052 ORGANISM="Chlamydomonas cf sp, Strain CCMP681" /NCGR_SAMPLE_ID=MMETSP1180 /ASSEMBLY_ACC=CAM_ASM_000741 /LENGTH=294 /DNA_ID=CAMNT_0007087317 /DNA_START=31 /DNA_END=915 /DNA_ORIENTATION=-